MTTLSNMVPQSCLGLLFVRHRGGAALSFLGVGIPPNVPIWGGMLELGRRSFDSTIWLVVFPGAVVAVVVFAVNFLGDALRDVVDPKLRGRS